MLVAVAQLVAAAVDQLDRLLIRCHGIDHESVLVMQPFLPNAPRSLSQAKAKVAVKVEEKPKVEAKADANAKAEVKVIEEKPKVEEKKVEVKAEAKVSNQWLVCYVGC